MAGRILILDDEVKMAALLARSLERSGYEAKAVSEPSQALAELKASRFDVLLTDLRMPGMDGLEILLRAKQIDPGIEVILMTAYASVETTREAMKRGAVDYLEKPISAEEDLKPLLERLLGGSPDREDKQAATRPSPVPARDAAAAAMQHGLGIECASPAMQAVYRKALKVAKSSASVLLRGESGTGKEVMADLVQSNSPRADKPYLKINCGALPENLLESELFGHVKGSFTGATADREGLFSAADGGTLLLDEVGEVTPALQVKLLRVLQQGELQRVGESVTRRVDVRVIAATNRPLEKMIESGEFRQDLYYRLNVVPLELPPLRQRREDLQALINHFLHRFAAGAAMRFTPAALEAINNYAWPGNIRELENAIEHAVVLADGTTIDVADLPVAVQDYAANGIRVAANPAAAVGDASLEEIEINCLMQALEKTGGNRTRAARILNITRRTLGYRLRKYGLEEEVNRRFSTHDED
ncbi:response regulator [bacterium]|nr:response regulator [bacterium]